MRARVPDIEGLCDRGDVKLAFQVYENDAPTLLLMPPWSIVYSQLWKAQVPYLARHWRVVTYDPRGNGRSDRPLDPSKYTDDVLAADAVAVMEATGTEKAVIVGLSRGARYAALATATNPERVHGTVLIAPSIPIGRPHPRFSPDHFRTDWDQPKGWQKWNAAHWLRDWADFVKFFAEQVFPEPHSTKQIEDTVRWGLETTPEVAVSTMAPTLDREQWTHLLAGIETPLLVLQGSEDTITPPDWGEEVARLTGGELIRLEGAGHGASARHPVVVNRCIHEFAGRVTGHVSQRTRYWSSRSRRSRRALFLSSPIGLGHVGRDLAIAEQLRQRIDGLQVDWLSEDPVTRVLADAGERVHPASRFLASESAHLVSESGEHDLQCFQAFRSMDELLVANFMLFQEVVEEGGYDVVVGDEAWDVDHFWHEHPDLKRSPLVWLTDFVGFLPMPDAHPHERELTADYNAEMLEHVERQGRVRDLALFVGNPQDIVPGRFGPNLPQIREWTEHRFLFPGYITGFDPRPLVAGREALRAGLGFAPDEQVCLVSVGGSGIGEHLLHRLAEALPLAQAENPALRMLLVTGPRIDPATIPATPGLEIHAYVPNLNRLLAACDLAVVQGGLTTTMELTALQRPFVYVPLKRHFEQQLHVPSRLAQYRAGYRLEYDDAKPERLAAIVNEQLGARPDYRPVERDGAERAADMIAGLL